MLFCLGFGCGFVGVLNALMVELEYLEILRIMWVLEEDSASEIRGQIWERRV